MIIINAYYDYDISSNCLSVPLQAWLMRPKPSGCQPSLHASHVDGVSSLQRERQATWQAVHHSHTLAMHVSFMQRERQGMSVSCGIFLKMCGPYKHQIYGGNMRKYISKLIETNYPISFHRGLDTWMVLFCWPMEVKPIEVKILCTAASGK